MEVKKYKVAKSPDDGLWYVIGYCGKGSRGQALYMPISSGYRNKSIADRHCRVQPAIDKSARDEVAGV